MWTSLCTCYLMLLFLTSFELQEWNKYNSAIPSIFTIHQHTTSQHGFVFVYVSESTRKEQKGTMESTWNAILLFDGWNTAERYNLHSMENQIWFVREKREKWKIHEQQTKVALMLVISRRYWTWMEWKLRGEFFSLEYLHYSLNAIHSQTT